MAKVSKDSFDKTQKLCNKLVCKEPLERTQSCSAKENSVMFSKKMDVVWLCNILSNWTGLLLGWCLLPQVLREQLPCKSCSCSLMFPGQTLTGLMTLQNSLISLPLWFQRNRHRYELIILRSINEECWVYSNNALSFTFCYYNMEVIQSQRLCHALQILLSLEKKQRTLIRSIRNPKLKCKRKIII